MTGKVMRKLTVPVMIALGASLTLVRAIDTTAQTVLQTSGVTEEFAREVAREAYIYAYPIMLMDVTREQMSNYAEPPADIPGVGPPNRFNHVRQFPSPDLKIVTQRGYALLARVGRSEGGAGGAVRAGDGPLLHAADAQHVD
jgi:hypothetical protein